MRRIRSISPVLAATLALTGCEELRSGTFSDFALGGGNTDDELGDEIQVPAEPSEEANVIAPPESDAQPPDVVDATLGTGGEFLGTTIASLGDPGRAGLWLRSPLVNEAVRGHIHYAATGRSIRVELIPSGGVEGSGSQVSLTAMQLLDAPLRGLLDLAVYRD